MCIILLAYQSHPKYELILAANRDEFYERPTRQAAFWQDAPDLLGGRDLQEGGTWLGITKQGRLAAVTNFRDPMSRKSDAPSRGALVSEFLRTSRTPGEYMEGLAPNATRYNGFNLIVGTPRHLYHYSNRADGAQVLTPGVYGVSNHLLDTPWPKVTRGKQALVELLGEDAHLSPEAIFNILANRLPAADESLPQTGIGLEQERILSPLFISSPMYGTRSSTVLLIDKEENVTFVERTFTAHSDQWKEASYQFKLRRNHESDTCA